MKRFIFAMIITMGLSYVALAQYKKGSVEEKLIALDRAWTFCRTKGR